MKILIGGDVAPINSNYEHFNNNSEVFMELQHLFDEADLSIVNLEVPLTVADKGALKSGVNLRGPLFAAESLKKSGVDVVSLANNHLGDYGEEGVIDTIRECGNFNLQTVGAGCNAREARKTLVVGNDIKVGIASYSDLEFGVATQDKSGVNPLILTDLTLDVIDLKGKSDYQIVILHEGKEHYAYPSPELQKVCRFIIDLGVDLVVCQHSHICGAWEKYKNSDIFYGQGNVMFDYANRNSQSWQTGYLIQVELFRDGKAQIKQLPFKQSFPGVVKLSSQEEKKFYCNSIEMQKNVLDEEFIKQSWLQFISDFRLNYFLIFKGYGLFLSKAFRFLNFLPFAYRQRQKAILLNIIRSRVHRESIITILERDLY